MTGVLFYLLLYLHYLEQWLAQGRLLINTCLSDWINEYSSFAEFSIKKSKAKILELCWQSENHNIIERDILFIIAPCPQD